MNPKVSVIICTYNRAAFLKEAIASVMAQSFSDWELIVINDGSTDETATVVADFMKQDKRIRYLSQSNLGLGGTRTKAPMLAKGEYLAFLDDDDFFLPDKLMKQTEFLDKNPDIGMVYGQVKMVKADNELIRIWPIQGATNFLELIRQCTIQPNACLVRKTCFEKVGTFNPHMNGSDDYEMWLRIAREYSIQFVPGTVGAYRWHHNNFSLNTKRRVKNLLRVYKVLQSQYSLNDEEKRQVITSVLFLTYFKAQEEMKSGNYAWAAFLIFSALKFSPKIGLELTWGSSKIWLYRLCRPYFAAVYCLMKGFFIPQKSKVPATQVVHE